MSRLIVSGTDTDIGKTIFSAALVAATGAAYWKPVQSGLADNSDSETVFRLSGAEILPEVYRLTEPLSPHRSAELDGLEIDPAKLTPPNHERLVIEAAGGLLVPLTRTLLFIDLIAQWKLPVILCARTGLGTINHTLLSLEAMRLRGIDCHGVAFIGDDNPDNMRTISEFSGTRILGRLPMLDKLDTANLADAFAHNFRLEDFA